MKSKSTLFLAALFVAGAVFILSSHAQAGLQWGGEGYDPASKQSGVETSVFSASVSLYEKDKLEINVDSKKTVQNVGSMTLTQASSGTDVKSLGCGKAMKHITAPWACSFPVDQIKGLSGKGEVSVFSTSGAELLKSDVDLDGLAQLVK